MQEVTTLLREVGGLVAQILDCLKGAASMEAPRLPLALGEFLEAWVIGSVTGFQNLRHPALLVRILLGVQCTGSPTHSLTQVTSFGIWAPRLTTVAVSGPCKLRA